MTYRVICQYLPDAAVHAVGRPGRGAWRVVACAQATPASAALMRPVLVLQPCAGFPQRLLVVTSHRHRQPNSWCSPRKIINEWLVAQQEIRHEIALHAAGEQAYEDYCARMDR